MKKTLTLLLLILSLSLSAFAQTGNAKRDKIKQMLQDSHINTLSAEMINMLMPMMEKQYPGVDPKVWEEFRKNINLDDFNNIMIDIYDKYFTESDIDQMMQFDRTSAGKKSNEVMPAVNHEVMLAAQQYGTRLAEQLVKEITANNTPTK